MTVQIKVVIVDDHGIFRSGVKSMLDLEEDVLVIGEASNGEDALEVLGELDPDVLLMDVNMPKLDGIELAWRLKNRGSRASIVALTALEDEQNVGDLSSSGVMGYVLKTSGYDDLIQAIRSVYRGERYVDPRVASRLLQSFSDHRNMAMAMDRLSDRELEVLYWLAKGMSGDALAEKLYLAEKTVKNHISHILAKLEVSDRTQAVAMAWKSGLVKKSPEKLR